MSDEVSDDEGRPPITDSSKKAAGTVGALLKSAMVLPIMVLSPLLSALPPGWRIFHKVHRWSGYQMQKSASADALANVRLRNGQEDIRPAAFVEGAEDEKDRSGWKIKGKGDKRYDPAVHGRSTSRFGKANMVHLNEDSTEQGTWAEATIDNALQLNREKYLFRDAKVTAEIRADAGGQGEAVADGGQAALWNVSIDRPGVLEDTLIPITSRAGYNGQVISWNQYSTLKSEQSDQETVRDAKNSAWAAAKLDDIESVDMLKWLLIIGVWSAILLFHQEIGAFIAGLSGGGSSGGAVGSALGMLAVWAKPDRGA